MLCPDKIREKLEKFNKCFKEDSWKTFSKDDLREYFSEDVEIHIPYGFPPVCGIDNMYQRMVIESSLFDHFEMQVEEPLVTGNRAAVCVTSTVRNNKTDDIIGFQAVQIIEFNEDYLVAKKEMYLDLEVFQHGIDEETLNTILKGGVINVEDKN